ncbi:MAG: hypothetical protein MMC33_010377 [Icmadophila ericetorum]|nr:hypothetical protein [Icmadophila ericetorum]
MLRVRLSAPVALLLLTCPYVFNARVSAAQKASQSSTQLITLSTCPFQTINYVTQTLPQQCLTTSWSSETATQESKNETSIQSQTVQKTPVVMPSEGLGYSDKKVSSGGSAQATSNATATPGIETPGTPNPPQQQDGGSQQASKELDTDSDADPLSDDANFLSFEEWKAQMLKKAGQSAEQLASARIGADNTETRRRPGINNALDSLGEDQEIELDFSGFVNPDVKAGDITSTNDGAAASSDERTGAEQKTESGPLSTRSSDAGKTCKERFNYASFDCAATVLKTNPECKGSTSILVENKDSYMLNLCSAKNKFFIAELCNDILVDTVVLGNFEFFSSTFRTFRVSVSDRYPVKLDKWRELGTFEATNTRGIQAFLVENPLIWARYLRIEFLTHYGNEYYCPVSLLRVHGKTMMDDYRNDMKASRGDEEDDAVSDQTYENENIETVSAEVIQTISETSFVEIVTPTPETTGVSTSTQNEIVPKSTAGIRDRYEESDQIRGISYRGVLFEQEALKISTCDAKRSSCEMESLIVAVAAPSTKTLTVGLVPNTTILTSVSAPATSTHLSEKAPPSVPSSVNSDPVKSVSVAPNVINQIKTEPVEKHSTSSPIPSQAKASSNQSSSISKTSQPPPPPTPTTQESFFKSIHKRLQLLESNSTLSLQYIEEQSRFLREAFAKVEKRQLSKTTTFLETLNTTVLSELRDFRMQYEQIWQSTVLELSSQREQSQRDLIALSARLSLLADEILFQKRVMIIQFFLVLLCLGLVIFSRNAGAASGPAYLELQAAVRDMVGKPGASFSRYLGQADSPPPESPTSRPTSRYGFFGRAMNHMRSPSSESTLLNGEERKSPSIEYSPPTPVSNEDNEQLDETPEEIDEEEEVEEEEDQHNDLATPETDLNIRRTVSDPEISTTGSQLKEEESSPVPVRTDPNAKEAATDDTGVSEGSGGTRDFRGRLFTPPTEDEELTPNLPPDLETET